MRLSIRDRAFAHSPFSNNPVPPVTFSEFMTWDREAPASEKTIYTDAEIHNAPDGVIVWLIEPIRNRPEVYEYMAENGRRFREVWTSDRWLLDATPNSRLVPFGGCWIAPEDRKIWPKSKGTSIIASVKRGSYEYELRHRVASMVDAYGADYIPLERKIDGLRDYRFHVVIENVRCDYWFTEKLIDCFVTGTVPIYRGCPSIGRFFDLGGIMLVDTEHEVVRALERATPERYESMLPAIRDNFWRAKDYLLAEDWLCRNAPHLMKSLAL